MIELFHDFDFVYLLLLKFHDILEYKTTDKSHGIAFISYILSVSYILLSI